MYIYIISLDIARAYSWVFPSPDLPELEDLKGHFDWVRTWVLSSQ